jgi:hypothetical protein
MTWTWYASHSPSFDSVRGKGVGGMLIRPHWIQQKASAHLALGLPGPHMHLLALHSAKQLSALCYGRSKDLSTLQQFGDRDE